MTDRQLTHDCEWIDERLEPWLDGELDGDEARDVAAHVADCPRCRAQAALARRVTEGLRATARPACPDDVVESLEERLRPRGRRLAPAMAAAVMAGALALGVVWQMNRGPAPQQPTRAELAQARADLELALGYVAAAGQTAGRDVGGVLAGEGVMRPIRSGLDVKVRIPVPHGAPHETTESNS